MTIDAGRTQSLGERLLASISTAFDTLDGDDSIQTICLRGRPDLFLAGADLPFFVRSLVSRDLERVLSFTRSAHVLLGRFASSRKRVVSYVEGPAIGAGLELALACEAIIGSPKAKFSLPETTLGIYPGMGGTQRTPRRIGPGLAKWMIFTGSIAPAAQALEIGLIDAICEEDQLWDEIDRCRVTDPAESDLAPRFAALEQLFLNQSLAELLDPTFDLPRDPQMTRTLLQVRRNAPIALRVAEALIDAGQKLTLAEGLEQELARLPEVFLSDDALTGLLTFGKRRASFSGR